MNALTRGMNFDLKCRRASYGAPTCPIEGSREVTRLAVGMQLPTYNTRGRHHFLPEEIANFVVRHLATARTVGGCFGGGAVGTQNEHVRRVAELAQGRRTMQRFTCPARHNVGREEAAKMPPTQPQEAPGLTK